jgi:hypothetical protein
MQLTQFSVDDGPHNSDGLLLHGWDGLKWSRSSEQIFRVDSGASAVVRLPSGGAAG